MRAFGICWKIILPLLALILAYVVYVMYDVWDFGDPEPQLLGFENWKVIKGEKGVEDIVWFGDVALASQDDRIEFWHLNNLDAPNGSIQILDPKADAMRKAELIGRPHGVWFHPLGIYLFQNKWLYVINHAYQGGERVEIFKIETEPDLHLIYESAIQFPIEDLNKLNDLVVIDKDSFYVTHWQTQNSSPTEGKDHSIPGKVKSLLGFTFTEWTGIHYCRNMQGYADWKRFVGTAHMANGITTDGTNLFVADSVGKKIHRYEIQPDLSLQLSEEILHDYAIDNIQYDEKSGKIYLSNCALILAHYPMFSKKVEAHGGFTWPREETWYPGGCSELSNVDGKWKIKVILNQNMYMGVASCVRQNNTLLMGSFFDDGYLKCNVDFQT